MLVQSVSLYVHPPNPSYIELPWGNYWVLPLKILLHRGTTVITRRAGASILHRGGSPRMTSLLCPINQSCSWSRRPSCGSRVKIALGAGELGLKVPEPITSLESARTRPHWWPLRTANESTEFPRSTGPSLAAELRRL